MRVLLLVSELEDYTISFANGISRHLPITLAVPRRRYDRIVDWFEPAVDLRLLEWPRHRSVANLPFLLGLTTLIRRERPNLIHLLSNTTLWLNFAVPFWGRIPVVTTIHDLQVHPGDRDTGVLPNWATTLIVRQSQDVIVHGENLRRLAIDRFKKTPERVHVLSHPAISRYVELARRERLSRRSDSKQFTVLLFGRIFAYKGLEQLIRAEALIENRIRNLRVVIAGRGDDPWSLRHLMGDLSRYDIRNHHIEDCEVAQLFLDADLVVLPYTEASQSGVLNLAAAFGKPTIVTDVGELRATVEPHRIGLVVPPGDPQQLANAIALLAERRDLLLELAANAEKWAQGCNAPAKVGGDAVELYRRITRREQLR